MAGQLWPGSDVFVSRTPRASARVSQASTRTCCSLCAQAVSVWSGETGGDASAWSCVSLGVRGSALLCGLGAVISFLLLDTGLQENRDSAATATAPLASMDLRDDAAATAGVGRQVHSCCATIPNALGPGSLDCCSRRSRNFSVPASRLLPARTATGIKPCWQLPPSFEQETFGELSRLDSGPR